MFMILPAFVFGLSCAGGGALYTACSVIGGITVLVALVSLLQRRAPGFLPVPLRTWTFLPLALRSLEPYDQLITSVTSQCRGGSVAMETEDEDDVTREKRVAKAAFNNHALVRDDGAYV